MCPPCNHNLSVPAKLPTRRAMTLIELVIAMTIMVMVAGTMGALAKTVQQGYEYNEGHGLATQHGRVAVDRITRTALEATANEHFPGMIVVAESVAGWRFPDTLVVWRPDGSAADPEGLPLFSELVIYTPHATLPNRLLEITVPGDNRIVPTVDDTSQWRTEIAAIKNSMRARAVVLTDLVRSGLVPEESSSAWRGAVRFETRLCPSQAEWDSYKAGYRDWDDLAWVQGIRGTSTGLRQVWLRMELQLMPGEGSVASDASGDRPIPFFGSAAHYHEMHR